MRPAPPLWSKREFARSLSDVAFWRPYLDGINQEHGLPDDGVEPVPGTGSTYPVFVFAGHVIKLFGHTRSWQVSFAAERAALEALSVGEVELAPRVLGEGALFGDTETPWRYLVISRVPGRPWGEAALSREERVSLAAELGAQSRCMCLLRPDGVPELASWRGLDVADAVRRSALPPHLAEQAESFVGGQAADGAAMVHGDVMHHHVFVERGRLSGVIDWGDAMVTDPHYELAKLHLDLFDCEKALLAAFLEAREWETGEDFARRALAQAILRQAHGLAQHHSMDVFYKLPERVPLGDIQTLEELAPVLFEV